MEENSNMPDAIARTATYDLFFHTGMSAEVENLRSYTEGSFHPVTLGQVLPLFGTCIDDASRQPRYRIHAKTGFGAFSTVWLARDLDEQYATLLQSFRVLANHK